MKDFFLKDAVTVAKLLLGYMIEHDGCSGMIVETEAYMSDPASHAYKKTPRSSIMFDTYGMWYIYFVYGMYNCINITTNGPKMPGAVLIRALQPIKGIDIIKQRRSSDNIYNLCSGPGKLCTALNIDRSFNNTGYDDKIKLIKYKSFKEEDIAASPRIGITNGKDLLWRFYLKENKFVSKK